MADELVDISAEQTPRRRLIGRPFRPGQSGNPGGRPKGDAPLRALAIQHGPEAIRALVALARGKKTPSVVRLAAWRELLDRGYGRPRQAIDLDAQVTTDTVVTHRHEPAAEPNPQNS